MKLEAKRWAHVGATTTLLVAGIVVGLVGPDTHVASADPAPGALTPDLIALAALNDIVQGDDSAVTARFDETTKEKLSAAALGQAWTSYQQLLGPYQSHGDPEDVARGELTVVNVPLQMQHEPGQFRLTVHPDGTVAGVFLLKEGVPVP
jgi:hypothetical protein